MVALSKGFLSGCCSSELVAVWIIFSHESSTSSIGCRLDFLIIISFHCFFYNVEAGSWYERNILSLPPCNKMITLISLQLLTSVVY